MSDYPVFDLRDGGKVEVRDYGGGQVVIEVTFPPESPGIVVASSEHSGRSLAIELRERYA